MQKILLTSALSLFLLAQTTLASTLRFAEIKNGQWSEVMKKDQDITIEFQQGDKILLSPILRGDLFKTEEAKASTIVVQKTFWLKTFQQELRISFDGTNYSSIPDVVSTDLMFGLGFNGQGRIDSVDAYITTTQK